MSPQIPPAIPPWWSPYPPPPSYAPGATSLAQAGPGVQSPAIGGYGGVYGGLTAAQASEPRTYMLPGPAAGGSQVLTTGSYGMPGADYWSTILAQAPGPLGTAQGRLYFESHNTQK